MILAKNGSYQLTGDDRHRLKKWCVQTKVLLKNWASICNGSIYNIVLSFDESKLYTNSEDKCLREWSVKEEKLISNWGKLHTGLIDDMLIIDKGKELVTYCSHGVLKYWDLVNRVLLRNFEKIFDGEIALCMFYMKSSDQNEGCGSLFVGGQDGVLKEIRIGCEKKDFDIVDWPKVFERGKVFCLAG